MNQTLSVFPFDGINTESLGHYLAGLGLLVATARRWPAIRACWQGGRFILLSDQIATADEIRQYLLAEWTPTPYDRWWYKAELTKVPGNIWKVRNEHPATDIRNLDAHIVPLTRNCFNPVFGTGGNVAKRNFAEVWKNAVKLLSKPEKGGWLDATLAGQADRGMPDLRGGGTWFVFANKTFNSGQGWYREGQLSPWSFLLSMEGAVLTGWRSEPATWFGFPSLCRLPVRFRAFSARDRRRNRPRKGRVLGSDLEQSRHAGQGQDAVAPRLGAAGRPSGAGSL